MDKLNLSPYDRMTAWVIEIDERLGTDFGKYLLGLGELWNSFKNNDNHDYKTALAFAVPVAAIITSAVPAYAQDTEKPNLLFFKKGDFDNKYWKSKPPQKVAKESDKRLMNEIIPKYDKNKNGYLDGEEKEDVVGNAEKDITNIADMKKISFEQALKMLEGSPGYHMLRGLLLMPSEEFYENHKKLYDALD